MLIPTLSFTLYPVKLFWTCFLSSVNLFVVLRLLHRWSWWWKRYEELLWTLFSITKHTVLEHFTFKKVSCILLWLYINISYFYFHRNTDSSCQAIKPYKKTYMTMLDTVLLLFLYSFTHPIFIIKQHTCGRHCSICYQLNTRIDTLDLSHFQDNLETMESYVLQEVCQSATVWE